MSRKEELNQLKKEELEMDTKRIENLIGNLDNVGLNNKKNEVSLSYVYIYIYLLYYSFFFFFFFKLLNKYFIIFFFFLNL